MKSTTVEKHCYASMLYYFEAVVLFYLKKSICLSFSQSRSKVTKGYSRIYSRKILDCILSSLNDCRPMIFVQSVEHQFITYCKIWRVDIESANKCFLCQLSINKSGFTWRFIVIPAHDKSCLLLKEHFFCDFYQ